MPMRTSVKRSRLLSLPAAITLLLIGCTKRDAPVDSTAGRSARATGAQAPVASLKGTAKQMPGQLTKPLDSYSGDELYTFIQTLSFTGDSVRDRKCKNDPACSSTPKPKKIKVGVAAVVGQDSVSAGTTPPFGVIYIRATNKGDAEEARYGMKPGNHLQYYVVVLPDSAGGMKWRLEQLDTRAGSRQHTSIGSGPFTGCNHAWVAGARADFKTCANSAKARDSVVKLGLLLQGGDDAPLWVTCSEGCCIAGAT